MENFNTLQTRVNFSIPEDLLREFKEILAVEGVSMSKAFSQFILNYINHLDKSFIKTKGLLKGRNISFVFPISEETWNKFKEKTEREEVWQSLIVAQFMRNYVDFTNMNAKKDRRT